MPELLGTVRLLTTGVVMEMSYSSGLHRQALFAIGLILFVFIMIVNISCLLYTSHWLGRIAANKSKDYLKSAYCRKVQLSADGETPGLYLLDPSPEDVYIEKEQEEAVRRQVLELKEPYHLISVLYFLEDKTVEEIARTVGRPVKTVQTQLYRAKVMLKKRLKEERLRE